MKLKAFILLISFTLLSCKNEKSVDALEVVQQEVVENFFKVSIECVVKNDDDFSLFYTEDGTTNFTVEPIWKGVKGSDDVQIIEYALPNEVFPTQLRLDFGLKGVQDEIILKGIKLEYMGNKKEMRGPEIGAFFRADENKCTFDPNTGMIKSVVKDGAKQNPSLYPHESVLGPELQKLGTSN